jgi:aspartyl-tRNA(Asn)/glutamyl-tRNA(Gln) amidotransferase subunit B
VKNLNSIRHLRHAIEIEIARLIALTEEGREIRQETRSYDADRGTTFAIRTKEDAEDYRYFPEPDLAPFTFTDDFIEGVRKAMPELPEHRQARYVNEFGLTPYDAEQLTEEKELSDCFDGIVAGTKHFKVLANFLIGPVRAHLNANNLDWQALEIPADHWNALVDLVATNKVNFSLAAQKILPVMMETGNTDPIQLAVDLDILQDAGADDIAAWVNQVLAAMPDKVDEYRKGKKGLIGLFVGEVKRISKGKADPRQTTALLQDKLNEKK